MLFPIQYLYPSFVKISPRVKMTEQIINKTIHNARSAPIMTLKNGKRKYIIDMVEKMIPKMVQAFVHPLISFPGRVSWNFSTFCPFAKGGLVSKQILVGSSLILLVGLSSKKGFLSAILSTTIIRVSSISDVINCNH